MKYILICSMELRWAKSNCIAWGGSLCESTSSIHQTYCCDPDPTCPKATACRSLVKSLFRYLDCLTLSQVPSRRACRTQTRAREHPSFWGYERRHWRVLSGCLVVLHLLPAEKQLVFLWINLAGTITGLALLLQPRKVNRSFQS